MRSVYGGNSDHALFCHNLTDIPVAFASRELLHSPRKFTGLVPIATAEQNEENKIKAFRRLITAYPL